MIGQLCDFMTGLEQGRVGNGNDSDPGNSEVLSFSFSRFGVGYCFCMHQYLINRCLGSNLYSYLKYHTA